MAYGKYINELKTISQPSQLSNDLVYIIYDEIKNKLIKVSLQNVINYLSSTITYDNDPVLSVDEYDNIKDQISAYNIKINNVEVSVHNDSNALKELNIPSYISYLKEDLNNNLQNINIDYSINNADWENLKFSLNTFLDLIGASNLNNMNNLDIYTTVYNSIRSFINCDLIKLSANTLTAISNIEKLLKANSNYNSPTYVEKLVKDKIITVYNDLTLKLKNTTETTILKLHGNKIYILKEYNTIRGILPASTEIENLSILLQIPTAVFNLTDFLLVSTDYHMTYSGATYDTDSYDVYDRCDLNTYSISAIIINNTTTPLNYEITFEKTFYYS